jgi:hypothetical protein
MKQFNYFILFVVCLCSCKKTEPSVIPTTIKVNIEPKSFTINFESHFDSAKIVALETKKESVIGSIGRIIVYNGRYFILDRLTNSVFVFGSDGQYINKIHAIGKGPGNYTGLQDFSIDEKKKKILLYSHRPYKLISFDMNLHFSSELKLKELFRNLSWVDDKVIFIGKPSHSDFMVQVNDLDSKTSNEFVESDKVAATFRTFGSIFPYILKSRNAYIAFPYSSVIYSYRKGAIEPAYKIDFGNKNFLESYFDKGLTPQGILAAATKNNYGFFITNFKETKNWLLFSYGKNIVVLYSKKDKTSTAFDYVINDKNCLNFENFFGHDGADENILAVNDAAEFKTQMQADKESKEVWGKVPQYVKDIDAHTTASSNPLITVYKLKAN